MAATLGTRYERIEAAKAAILSLLDGLDDEHLNRRPPGNEWSAIQVICHLVRAESLSLHYIRKKMLGDDHDDGGLRGKLRSGALSLILKLPFRYQAPARSGELPARAELEPTRREWEEGRAGWKELVDSLSPEQARKTIFRHPVAGPLTLSQTLRFMDNHIKRHTGQVERILCRS